MEEIKIRFWNKEALKFLAYGMSLPQDNEPNIRLKSKQDQQWESTKGLSLLKVKRLLKVWVYFRLVSLVQVQCAVSTPKLYYKSQAGTSLTSYAIVLLAAQCSFFDIWLLWYMAAPTKLKPKQILYNPLHGNFNNNIKIQWKL